MSILLQFKILTCGMVFRYLPPVALLFFLLLLAFKRLEYVYISQTGLSLLQKFLSFHYFSIETIFAGLISYSPLCISVLLIRLLVLMCTTGTVKVLIHTIS